MVEMDEEDEDDNTVGPTRDPEAPTPGIPDAAAAPNPQPSPAGISTEQNTNSKRGRTNDSPIASQAVAGATAPNPLPSSTSISTEPSTKRRKYIDFESNSTLGAGSGTQEIP